MGFSLRRKLLAVLGVAATLTIAASTAWGQAAGYPSKSINVLIGFAPGGGSDVMLTMVRPHLERVLKTTLVPVYKPGAGSDIALTELAQAKPDGYTIGITTTPQIPINAIVRKTEYSLSDLILTANVVTDPGILVVRTESPIKTMAEFTKAAQDKPGTISVGVSSAPGDDWFAVHMYQEAAKVKLNIVTFSGDGPSWQAALAGHTDGSFNNLGIVYPQVTAGKLRALAIMTDARSPHLPDVPTFKELGYNVTSGSARGFSFPKGTPPEIVNAFSNAVKQVMDSPEFKANAQKTAFPSDYQDPKAYAASIKNMEAIYRPLWDKFGSTAQPPAK